MENNYFDRVDEPGSIKISLLTVKGNETEGGSEKGEKLDVSEHFNVHTSSPQEGTIRIGLNPKADVRVGEDMELKVTLTGAGEEFEEIFWAKITDPEMPKQEMPKPEPEVEQMGLPETILVYPKARRVDYLEIANSIDGGSLPNCEYHTRKFSRHVATASILDSLVTPKVPSTPKVFSPISTVQY